MYLSSSLNVCNGALFIQFVQRGIVGQFRRLEIHICTPSTARSDCSSSSWFPTQLLRWVTEVVSRISCISLSQWQFRRGRKFPPRSRSLCLFVLALHATHLLKNCPFILIPSLPLSPHRRIRVTDQKPMNLDSWLFFILGNVLLFWLWCGCSGWRFVQAAGPFQPEERLSFTSLVGWVDRPLTHSLIVTGLNIHPHKIQ